MMAILLDRHLQSVANYLILSLALADLLVAVLVMPLGAVNEVGHEDSPTLSNIVQHSPDSSPQYNQQINIIIALMIKDGEIFNKGFLFLSFKPHKPSLAQAFYFPALSGTLYARLNVILLAVNLPCASDQRLLDIRTVPL